MAKPTGFLEIERRDRGYRKAPERVASYDEFIVPLGDAGKKEQTTRCMGCGSPV